MKTLNMDSILTKALLNGFISWILLALFFSALHTDVTLIQALVSLPNICLAIASAIGSYIGYKRRESR